jgi:AGCS family alanine or glycine:cation symporter
VVICLITGLVLVTTIMKFPSGMEGLKGAQLTKVAFAQIPHVGPAVLVA